MREIVYQTIGKTIICSVRVKVQQAYNFD